MWFEQLVRAETGCVTYMIGSTTGDECVVYDPLWDTAPYVQLAARRSCNIIKVIDSHSHADHVSGARKLAKQAGAELILPERAEIRYEASRAKAGDVIEFSEVRLEFFAAPGHRPEQLCLIVTDTSRGPEPWCMLTADFLLVGDVARPDLAQDGEEGARTLFEESIPNLERFPDFMEIYPGHVSGST